MGLLCHDGKIDAGYRGEMHLFLTALTRSVRLARGDRLGQLVVVRIVPPNCFLPRGSNSPRMRSSFEFVFAERSISRSPPLATPRPLAKSFRSPGLSPSQPSHALQVSPRPSWTNVWHLLSWASSCRYG